jgi:hypothetical protein
MQGISFVVSPIRDHALWDGPPLNDRRYHDGGLEEEKTNGESEN